MTDNKEKIKVWVVSVKGSKTSLCDLNIWNRVLHVYDSKEKAVEREKYLLSLNDKFGGEKFCFDITETTIQ